MRDADSEPEQSAAGEDAAAESGDSGRRRGVERLKELRPAVWLGTVSTVVAIATGMFTLRDQIFPKDAGTASASLVGYQQSVAGICDALNQLNNDRAVNAANLKTQLADAGTVADERNAILDSWNQVLEPSQRELGILEGLTAPPTLKKAASVTADAWQRYVTLLGGFTQRLDTASNVGGVFAAVKSLPRLRTALGRADEAIASGLTTLGGGHCGLAVPVSVSAVTMRGASDVGPPGSIAVKKSARMSTPAGSGARAKTLGPATTLGPNVVPPDTSSPNLGPNVAPPDSYRP